MSGSQLSREYGEKEFGSGKSPTSFVTGGDSLVEQRNPQINPQKGGGDLNRRLRESMVEIYWEISEMKISDYNDVINLWRNAGYIHLSNADSKNNIEAYLKRNSGLSFVVRTEEKLIGAILAGEDGRRGFLHHLAIERRYRKMGIGHALVERCLVRLKERNISKCHTFVLKENEKGNQFWTAIGWKERGDLKMMSLEIA